MHILVLNGPNLNLLGTRETQIYGKQSLADVELELKREFPEVSFQFAQSNHEGMLIDEIQGALDNRMDGIVFNPGAFTHTSVALRDAIAAIDTPVVEVHLSNIHAREEFRRTSLLAPACIGQISGLGTAGYVLAVRYFTRDSA